MQSRRADFVTGQPGLVLSSMFCLESQQLATIVVDEHWSFVVAWHCQTISSHPEIGGFWSSMTWVNWRSVSRSWRSLFSTDLPNLGTMTNGMASWNSPFFGKKTSGTWWILLGSLPDFIAGTSFCWSQFQWNCCRQRQLESGYFPCLPRWTISILKPVEMIPLRFTSTQKVAEKNPFLYVFPDPFGGFKQYKSMVIFRDFPYHNALFGLEIFFSIVNDAGPFLSFRLANEPSFIADSTDPIQRNSR